MPFYQTANDLMAYTKSRPEPLDDGHDKASAEQLMSPVPIEPKPKSDSTMTVVLAVVGSIVGVVLLLVAARRMLKRKNTIESV